MASVYDKAKVKLVTSEPFYAALLLGLREVRGDVLPSGQPLWLAATDGDNLYVNVDEMNKLTVDECMGVLKHEVSHVAMLHPWRRGDRDPTTWNVATDYVINAHIVADGGKLPKGVLLSEEWGVDNSAEEVYSKIADETGDPGSGDGTTDDGDSEGQGGSGDQDGNGERPGNPLSGDLMRASDASPEAQHKALRRVVQAAQVAKAMGKLPAFAEELIGNLMKPVVDWKEELSDFLTEVSRDDYSFARPNRKFLYADMYLPGPSGTGAMQDLAVVLDTSGSISQDEMRRFVSEVIEAVSMVRPTRLIVVYCDAAVQHVDTFEQPTVQEVEESVRRYGCGGTDMTVALDHIDEHYPGTAAAIVFTDGYTPFGNDRGYPVLWAMTSDGIEAPFGRTIHVPVEE